MIGHWRQYPLGFTPHDTFKLRYIDKYISYCISSRNSYRAVRREGEPNCLYNRIVTVGMPAETVRGMANAYA
jgi:hypothetical protein